ncbi:MAG: VWA domain-containing protein [Legionellales bacterium]|nr:VWA domain-containing protein [Legionellales bacterium]
MFKLEYPYALLLVLLPIITMKIRTNSIQQLRALKIPNYTAIKQLGFSANTMGGSLVAKIILGLMWILLCIAISGPKWVDDPIELPRKGRDIILAIDVSESMARQDMLVSGRPEDRLSVVKKVAIDFVEKRIGDRLGLILFGTKAYLQTPLTFDRKTVKHMINDTTISIAGPLTAIGDAIGLTIKKLRNIVSDSKILVLLTDGSNTAGAVEPIKAAEMAKANNIKIYTVGLGADAIKVKSIFGTQIVNPSADLDDELLKQISELTNGRFFRAMSTEQLQDIYQEIDKLEPNDKDGGAFTPEQELFYWPLGLAFLLSIFLLIRKLTPLSRWI